MQFRAPTLSSSLRFHTAVLLAALALLDPRAGQAADFDKLDSSLKEIPADASFYVSLMRNREQVEAVLNSKAWARLKEMPAMKQAWEAALLELDKPESPYAQYQKWVKEPENRELMDLLLEMVSDEVFIYGGSNVTEVSDLYGRMLSSGFMEAMRQGFVTSRKKEEPPKIDETQVTRLMLRESARNPNAVTVPEIVIGCKVANPERALTQIKRLEKLIQDALDRDPEAKKFKDKLKWVKVANGNFLTFSFSSKDANFDEESIRKYEEKPGEYAAVIKRMKEIQYSISLGVRGKYVLLAIGETTAPLAKLGTGKRLIDQPELKPLAPFADQRLTSVSYLSKAFRSTTSASYFDLNKWLTAGRDALPSSTLSKDMQARLHKDLTTFLDERKAREPKPGAELSFAFLTTRGKESYEYDWSEHPSDDGSRPLTILNHVGGDPLFVSAGRSKYDPQAWPRFVRWFKVYWGYIEEFGQTEVKPEDKKTYDEFMKLAKPLLARFDEATGKMLLPSLADGQSAFVVDAKFSSKQWHSSVPLAQAVTIPEPALLYGVSDADLLRKAMGEYRSIANDWLAALQQASPTPPPIKELPAPESRKIKGGTLYYYPLPNALGVEPRLASQCRAVRQADGPDALAGAQRTTAGRDAAQAIGQAAGRHQAAAGRCDAVQLCRRR